MIKLNYDLKLNGANVSLIVDDTATPLEVYNVIVWRKEYDVNSHNVGDDILYDRARELGIYRFFK